LNKQTVADCIEAAAGRLEAAGVVFGHGTSSAWDEATALVLAVAELPDDRRSLTAAVSSAQLERIEHLLQRRCDERIPLPYLLGVAYFAGYRFDITAGVVIPRSPIAELIGRRFEPWLREPPQRIIDLCCGSGCIGIAAALTFPRSTLVLADIDADAVVLAGRNVCRHGLESRTEVVQSDLWDQISPGTFDLILCNPPYVDATDMRTLPREYQHEPVLGLAGGEDGLDIVHRLLAVRNERLNADGLLVCEVGASAAALSRAYPELPLFWPDLERGGEGVFLLSSVLA